MLRKDKKGMELEMLGWILLGLAALAIALIAFFFLIKNDVSAIDYIKSLFGFG